MSNIVAQFGTQNNLQQVFIEFILCVPEMEAAMPDTQRFKSIAFALAACGTLAVSPAHSQQLQATPVSTTSGVDTSDVTLQTDCHEYKRGVLMADTACLIRQGQLLKTESATVKAEKKAVTEILAKQKANADFREKVKPLVMDGTVTRGMLLKYGKDGMCELAATLRLS